MRNAGEEEFSAYPVLTRAEKLPSGDVVVLAGGQFVQGSTSGVGAMCRLRPPYSVHLYGGTHWAQWASIMAFALPKLMEHSVSS